MRSLFWLHFVNLFHVNFSNGTTTKTQLFEILVFENMQAFWKFQSAKGGRLLKFSVWKVSRKFQNLVHQPRKALHQWLGAYSPTPETKLEEKSATDVEMTQFVERERMATLTLSTKYQVAAYWTNHPTVWIVSPWHCSPLIKGEHDKRNCLQHMDNFPLVLGH